MMKISSPYLDTIHYNIEDDLKAYPEAWCYVIIGGRNTGKTYSALRYHLQNGYKHVFCKRTSKDVDLLCAGNTIGEKCPFVELDFSPYKSINRDFDTKIMAYKIKDGIGAFYSQDEEGRAAGSPYGYIASLSTVKTVKGFDLSDCESVIFDEFIPQPTERTSKMEGEAVMELYKTVARDRTLRGRKELKLLLLANAVNVFNYTCEVLELTDVIAEMSMTNTETLYQDDRGIFIRILKTPEEIMEAEKKTGIYKAMANTAWGRMAFSNEFAYNDFSNIKKISVKGYRPLIKLTYKGKEYYIYSSDNAYYMCTVKGKCPIKYDLDKEMGRKAFYYDYAIDFLNSCIEGKMLFEKYSMYDLIVNYKKRFNV